MKMIKIMLFLALAAVLPLVAQPKSVQEITTFERGRRVFIEGDCYSCHGWYHVPQERWGDLAKSGVVGADNEGEVLKPFVRRGIPCRPNLPTPMMPAFYDFTEEQMNDLVTYIHFERQTRRYNELISSKNTAAGDAAAGKAFFSGKGKCADCHAANLAGVAKKHSPLALREQTLRPDNATGAGLEAHRKLLERSSPVEVNNVLAYLATLN